MSARSKFGDSSSAVGTPSKKTRGIRVILGCRNNARLQDHSSDRHPQTEAELDDVHKLPIEYPHTDLSMSHSGSYSATSTKEESVSNADKECTLESEVIKCIQGLKDYISSIAQPDWLSSDILLSSMDKVNVLTSFSAGCFPSMAFGDSRTVHSDSSIIMDSKESTAVTGASRVRSWPLTSNDVYFETAAKDQAEELKRITAKLEKERQQHEILSILIYNLKKEIIRMSKKESEMNQANAQAAVKTRLMNEKLEIQLVNQQDQLQKMEGRWHAESEQVVKLKSEISRLTTEIIAVTARMRELEYEGRQTAEANEVELLVKADQLKTSKDNLNSECQKNSTLQPQCSDAKSKSNMALRDIDETPSVELEGVEYDLVAFNANSIQKETEGNDALIESSGVYNTTVQEVVMQSSYAENGTNVEEINSSDSHTTSSESFINSLKVKRKLPGWFLHLTHESDDKSQSTNGSSIPIGCLRPNVWCIGTNNDLTTVDDSQIASRDGIDDKLGYSTSCSRSFDSTTEEKLLKQLSSDSSSTQSSESEVMMVPLPSDSSDVSESSEKNPATYKGNKGPMSWFRNKKGAEVRHDNRGIQERDRSTMRGMILVQ